MALSPLKKAVIYSSATICIAACFIDLVLIYVFGNRIPGFDQLKDVLSTLGDSSSPVANQVTVWSVLLGGIFVFYAFGFRMVFHTYGTATQRVFWLITLYALGEDILSGLIRNDKINGAMTNLALLHDLLGGVGVTALLLLPLVMISIFNKQNYPRFHRYSLIVFATGLSSTILFSFRIDYFANTFLNIYSGLWQRIFLVNYYVYFIAIAFIIIRHANLLTKTE